MSAPVSTHVLIEALSIASLSAVSYVSTNLDNLILLSAYGAKPGYRSFNIKLTFVFVCLAVLLVSLALARAADTFPTENIRYLGLIPIALGAYQLVRLMMGWGGDKSDGPDETPGPIGFATHFAFALVLLANSSDSVSIMMPLFADLKPMFVLICFGSNGGDHDGFARQLSRPSACDAVLCRKDREMGSALPPDRHRFAHIYR